MPLGSFGCSNQPALWLRSERSSLTWAHSVSGRKRRESRKGRGAGTLRIWVPPVGSALTAPLWHRSDDIMSLSPRVHLETGKRPTLPDPRACCDPYLRPSGGGGRAPSGVGVGVGEAPSVSATGSKRWLLLLPQHRHKLPACPGTSPEELFAVHCPGVRAGSSPCLSSQAASLLSPLVCVRIADILMWVLHAENFHV